MSELYAENDLLLDEPIYKPEKLWVMLVVAGISALIGAVLTAMEQLAGVGLLLVAAFILVFVLLLWAVYFLYLRRRRVRMDATRVWTHSPLTQDRSLEWQDIRTAAIVNLKIDKGQHQRIIVLSIHDSSETLTYKNMHWKNPKRGQELRFPFKDTRRAVIEQQLDMTLPEVNVRL